MPAFTPSVKHRARKELLELTEQVSCDSCFSLLGGFVCWFPLSSPSRRKCHGLRSLCQDRTQDPKSNSKCMPSLLHFQQGLGQTKYLPSGSQEGLEAPLCIILMKHLVTRYLSPL